MNKKILAVAVSAAMFAAASTAMAGEAEVYGLVHMSLDSMSGGDKAAGRADGVYVSSNSSRLGVKGAEDLGNGMKAIFQYEMGVNVSDGSALSMDRNSYAGLKGGFGQVIVGRHDMPFKTAVRKFDLFGDTIGDNRAITRLKGAGDDWAMRRSDILMYTNKFGDVDLDVAYGAEDGTKNSADMGARVTYKGGPLTVMGAYENHGKGHLTGGTSDSTGMILAASYGLGDITLAAGYISLSSIGGSNTDATGWTAAAAYKAGSSTFKVQHTAAEADPGAGSKPKGSVTALGADYAMSKNTKLYAVYAVADNGDGLVSKLDGGGGHDATITATTKDPKGFSVGMVHKF